MHDVRDMEQLRVMETLSAGKGRPTCWTTDRRATCSKENQTKDSWCELLNYKKPMLCMCIFLQGIFEHVCWVGKSQLYFIKWKFFFFIYHWDKVGDRGAIFVIWTFDKKDMCLACTTLSYHFWTVLEFSKISV